MMGTKLVNNAIPPKTALRMPQTLIDLAAC